ncbi:hypothetical protein ACJX0J_002661, partial [Zea mays]
ELFPLYESILFQFLPETSQEKSRIGSKIDGINIYILLVQEEDCTMREAQRGQSLPIRQEDSKVKASLLIQFFILTLKNESNLPKDVIYSLSLSIYGKNCTHAMIFKSFLLKWNSDFRTISYKRMEIHHFAMKTT